MLLGVDVVEAVTGGSVSFTHRSSKLVAPYCVVFAGAVITSG